MTNILNLYNNNVQIKSLMCFLEHFASTSPNMKTLAQVLWWKICSGFERNDKVNFSSYLEIVYGNWGIKVLTEGVQNEAHKITNGLRYAISKSLHTKVFLGPSISMLNTINSFSTHVCFPWNLIDERSNSSIKHN